MGSRNCEILLRGKATGRRRVFAPGLPIADIPVLNEGLASYRRQSRRRKMLGTRAESHCKSLIAQSMDNTDGGVVCTRVNVCTVPCIVRADTDGIL